MCSFRAERFRHRPAFRNVRDGLHNPSRASWDIPHPAARKALRRYAVEDAQYLPWPPMRVTDRPRSEETNWLPSGIAPSAARRDSQLPAERAPRSQARARLPGSSLEQVLRFPITQKNKANHRRLLLVNLNTDLSPFLQYQQVSGRGYVTPCFLAGYASLTRRGLRPFILWDVMISSKGNEDAKRK